MNKEAQHERMPSSSDSNHISIHDYAIYLKLSGFTMEEALDIVEQKAIHDGIKLIYVQTGVVLKVYLDKNIKVGGRRLITGKHTDAEWEAKKNEYDNKCAYCGKGNIKLTKDHIVPVSLGGTGDIGNIVPACQSCNSRKNIRNAEYFKEIIELEF